MATRFHALRHRNYRLFFTGQSISLAGTWITRTSWLVYRLTGSVLLAAPALGGVITVLHILLLSIAQGIIDALDTPAISFVALPGIIVLPPAEGAA